MQVFFAKHNKRLQIMKALYVLDDQNKTWLAPSFESDESLNRLYLETERWSVSISLLLIHNDV